MLNSKILNKFETNQKLLALASGILMGLSPETTSAWYLSWLSLAPLWFLVINSKKSLKQVCLLSLCWGCGYHGLALFWITGIHPMTWMGIPWLASLLIALFCWLFITIWGASLVVAWGFLLVLVSQKIPEISKKFFLGKILFRLLVGLTLWCCLESLWSHGSLWWSSLSYTQSPHNLIILQLGKISGYNTITASIVLVNGVLAEVFLHWNKFSTNRTKIIAIALPFFLVISLHLLGFYLYIIPISQDNLNPIKVGIIQGNIPNELKLYPEGWSKAIDGYTTGYRKLAKQQVDIVLTPETALPFYWNTIINNSSFYQVVLEEKIPAWIGAFGRDGKDFTNSLFTLSGEGKTLSRYDKYKLVPFGEYIPFKSILGKIINRLSPLDADLAPGKPQQTFNTPFGQAIVGICYESAFSEHFRRQAKKGGQYIITASNNAHYSNTMPAQHHAQDVMRAIETDRWAARATNTGYSGIVDPHGRTLWRSEINQYATYAGTIYQRNTETLYVQWGDWLTLTLLTFSTICVAIFLLAFII